MAGLAPGDADYRADYLLEKLGLSGDEKPGEVSGGEARRAALVRALAPDPDILLLDRSEEHTSELQTRLHLVCRLLLEKKKTPMNNACRWTSPFRIVVPRA